MLFLDRLSWKSVLLNKTPFKSTLMLSSSSLLSSRFKFYNLFREIVLSVLLSEEALEMGTAFEADEVVGQVQHFQLGLQVLKQFVGSHERNSVVFQVHFTKRTHLFECRRETAYVLVPQFQITTNYYHSVIRYFIFRRFPFCWNKPILLGRIFFIY
jgi:ribonuclease P protein component